jgi:hypothetical protein
VKRQATSTILCGVFAMFCLLGVAQHGQAEDAKTKYPNMAPIGQYSMERNAEIAMARSAAPETISGDAKILVLGAHGYETAAEGKNGFVCMVQRSWTAGVDDPEFWNPKIRAPICFNPAAARSNLPLVILKTAWALAGQSKAQISDSLKSAFDQKELSSPEAGAMCYMMSKAGYLNDRDGHWHPHLMFFVPPTDAEDWGANLSGSPILAASDPQDRLTLFLVPVGRWSDGTAGPPLE